MSQKKSFKPGLIAAFSFLLVVITCAIFAEYIAPYPQGESNIADQLCTLSSKHPLGCDTHGADVLSQLIFELESLS